MDALEAAGLTKNEAKLYKILLKWSSGNVTELSRASRIHRRSVYDVLQRLSDKGLVSYIIKDGVKRNIANNPERLKEIIDEKEKSINEELPNLIGMFKQNTEKKSTQFFMGKKGIQYILDEQLAVKKEVLILGGSNVAHDMLKYYFPKYDLIRKEKKIPMKIIYSGDKKKKHKHPLSKEKHMPKGMGGDMALNIYGKNVALIMWNEENPFAILINQKEVADNFRDYFKFIWDKL